MSTATQIVAIDGPAGAGKSTVARRAADQLDFAFLDTGAMYRAATWWAMHCNVDLDDPQALVASTREMDLRMQDRPEPKVEVNGHDITEAIRTPEVTRLIFKLDQNSAVRVQLVELQRRFGERQPTVAEGRDIGTVVFPQARCKIYLDASLEERTRRRWAQLQAKGNKVDFQELMAEIHARDEKTMNRADSPLRPAADAVILDTTHLSLPAVIDEIVRLARERL